MAAAGFGVRVVVPRISMVLGRDGGALAKMEPFFRLGLGGRIGTGEQWISWIHIDDLVDLVAFAIDHDLRGSVNACSPDPVVNAEFTRSLARTLHRPAILPVPEFALRLRFGEMANILVASQRVVPEAARRAGFIFRFPEIDAAFNDLFRGSR